MFKIKIDAATADIIYDMARGKYGTSRGCMDSIGGYISGSLSVLMADSMWFREIILQLDTSPYILKVQSSPTSNARLAYIIFLSWVKSNLVF